MQLTLKQICDALRISRSRIEQWISRGYFRPPQQPILGMARDWEVIDAMRLALMTEMLDGGMTAQQAGALVYIDPDGFENDEAFFVAWQGYHDPVNYPNGSNAEPVEAYTPGTWYSDIIRRRDLIGFIGSKCVTVSLVINLNNLELRVKRALENNQ